MMLRFFEYVHGAPDPATGLAGTGGLVVTQVVVQPFYNLDALAEIRGKLVFRLLAQVLEVLQAGFPTATFRSVTLVAAFTGGLVEALVRVIPGFDELPDKQAGEH
jgi:hypothetical protein